MAKLSLFLFGIGLTLVGLLLFVSNMTGLQATSGSQAFLLIIDFVIFFLGMYLTIKSLLIKTVSRKDRVKVAYPDEKLQPIEEDDVVDDYF